MTQITINGRSITAEAGTNVLAAALASGIEIPHLCYHPELSISGNCRLCLVEVEGARAPAAACGLTCQEGMVVRTHSPVLFEMRRAVLELLLAGHPLNCLTCEKSGACLLQKYAYEYGLQGTRYGENGRRDPYHDENPFFVRDLQYCIRCGRCVRVCDEIVGAHAIDFSGRGYRTHIATALDVDPRDTDCVFCGSCVQVCPTAALRPVSRAGGGREWELERVRTICGYCGVGCEVEYAVKDGRIVYAQGTPEGAVNGEFLCTKGRFGWDYAGHRERLTRPLLRRDVAHQLGLITEAWELPETSPLDADPAALSQDFIPVDWDTALNYVAGRLAETVRAHGPNSVMGLASARCTNEENYLFQKFFRASIKTNNIDHCARL